MGVQKRGDVGIYADIWGTKLRRAGEEVELVGVGVVAGVLREGGAGACARCPHGRMALDRLPYCAARIRLAGFWTAQRNPMPGTGIGAGVAAKARNGLRS